MAQRLITGRAAWEIETQANKVVALWPLLSRFLEVIPADGGTRYFDYFQYKIKPGEPVRLPADNVFYTYRPSQTDYRQPESPLQAASLDISVAVMSDKYDYAFLQNDSTPPTVITVAPFSSDEIRQAFRDQWRGEYAGVDNAGKPVFLESSGVDGTASGAIDIKTLGMSQKDSLAYERYNKALRNISIALGVPMSKLDASGRTFDNASEEDRTFWNSTMLPLMRRLQNAVNIQLAPRLGSEVGWFDISDIDVLRPPKFYSQVSLVDMVAAEIISKDEARAEVRLEPAAKAAPELVEEVAPLPVVPLLPPPPTTGPPERKTPKAEQRQDITNEVRRARIWVKADQQVRAMEGTWERSWRALFTKQEEATLARLEGKRGRQAIEKRDIIDARALFDLTHWESLTAAEVRRLYEMVATAGAMRVAARFDFNFELNAPYVQDFIAGRSNQLAGQVTRTTYTAIKAALQEGVAAGEGIPQLADRVRSVFSQARLTRATTIARTEVISAYNGSAHLVAMQLPPDVVAGQEWISTADGRTRGSHRTDQVVPIGQPFNIGGYDLAYPGDPNGPSDEVVNCRCTTALLTPAEMSQRAPQWIEYREAVRRLAGAFARREVAA